MSTLTDSFPVMNAPLERRFYPRVAPSELVHIAVGPDKQAALLNLSENGLLVSAPHGLAINSVHRVSLSLRDIPEQIPNSIPNSIVNSINVHVRAIWTAASQKIAGLQFLDLSETDRDQIRKWAELQSSKNDSFESWTLPKNAEASPESAPLSAIESQGQPPFAPALIAPPCSDISLLAGDAASQEISSRETASRHDASAVRTTTQSSAPVLIFWSIALATILLVIVWASGHNLSDKLLSRSAHIQKASASESEVPAPASTQAALDSTAAPPASASSEAGVRQEDVAQQDAAPQDVAQQHDAAESATAENSADVSGSLPPIRENYTIEPPSTKSRFTKPKFPRSKLANPNLSASSTRPFEPQAPLTSRPSVVESTPSRTQTATQTSTPPQRATSSQTAATSQSSASSKSSGPLQNGNVSASPASPNTAGSNPESPGTRPARTADATQPSANTPRAFPKTLSVDAATRQPSAATSNSNQPNSTRSNDFAASKPTQRASITAPGTVFPSASAVDTSANIPRASSPTAMKPDNPDAKRELQPEVRPELQPEVHPDARPEALSEPSIFQLPASRSASFVNLPGERVLQSPGVTIHVQRSVWVRAGHWFWHGHKKVALGALSSHVDPQPPRSASPSGTIAVQATIDEEGRVIALKPLYGSLAYLPNVSRAIRAWRYEPTYVDNKPVETLAKIEVNFHSPSARSSRP